MGTSLASLADRQTVSDNNGGRLCIRIRTLSFFEMTNLASVPSSVFSIGGSGSRRVGCDTIGQK